MTTGCGLTRGSLPGWSRAVGRWLWRRLARAPEAVARAPRGPAASRECRAARSRQARAEEAEETRWGAAKALHPLGAAQGGVLGGAALARCRSSRESSPSSLTSMASKIAPTWLG